MSVHPAETGEVAVPFGRLATDAEAVYDLVQVGDQDAGVALAGGPEVVFDPQMELHTAGSEPGPSAGGQSQRLVDLAHAENAGIEGAGILFLSRWYHQLHVMQTFVHNRQFAPRTGRSQADDGFGAARLSGVDQHGLITDDSTDTARPWREPATYWPAMNAATAHLDPPFATLDAQALSWNAADMTRRAASKPLRIATKSIRVRAVIESLLSQEGFNGVLAFTLPEAVWLAERIDDVVVGYPTVHREALRRIATDDRLAGRITVMVDSVKHLDAIDAVIGPRERASIRVCLELDASWRPRLLGRHGPHIGARRSPVHSAVDARSMAQIIAARPGFHLVGMMAYEAQIAGLANAPRGKPLVGAVIRRIQQMSVTELRQRRGEAVAAVRAVADLEFVNGGGTGSIESTARDDAVTEIAAGSGLFGPHLFDRYAAFTPAPAAAFALPVVRRPVPGMATLLGGGWIASGPPAADRVPEVAWPPGTKMVASEMAGEVQTPLSNAGSVGVGDRVWLRHTKSGELCEHVNELAVVCGGDVTERLPTYRGEGQAFL